MLDTTWIESSVFWRTRLNRWILKEHSLAAVHAAGTGRKIITAINWVLERPVTVLWNRRMWKTIASGKDAAMNVLTLLCVCGQSDRVPEQWNSKACNLHLPSNSFFYANKIIKNETKHRTSEMQLEYFHRTFISFMKALIICLLKLQPLHQCTGRSPLLNIALYVTIKLSYVFFDLLSCLLFFSHLVFDKQ